MTTTTTTHLAEARRVVIKIGSTLLVDSERGILHRRWLATLVDDVADLCTRGKEVVLVSSGAVALGRRHLRLADGPLRLEEKQAAAATGMIRLAHAYQESLAQYDLTVAQVLLTPDDTENRRRYLNARNTLTTLLSVGAVPLINENDTVATEELRFGDNDRLAARVAAMIGADTLILFSDIDGLYTADPRQDATAAFVTEVEEVTTEIEGMAGAAGSNFGSGGMVTKLAAARIALAGGCAMAIAPGHPLHPVRVLSEGGRCTWFLPRSNPLTARKRWIAGSLKPEGEISVDAGALNALTQGKSLLPAGVTGVRGDFQRGDPVVVRAPDGREVARGLSAYSAEDTRRLMGHRTGEIVDLLGYRGRDEIIHRDDLVFRA